MTDEYNVGHEEAIRALWDADANPHPPPRRRAVEWALRRLADGQHDDKDLAFVRVLASRLLAASATGGGVGAQRAQKIMKASGLWGRKPSEVGDAMLTAELFGGSALEKVKFAKKTFPEQMQRVRDDPDAERSAIRALQRARKRQK